MARVFYGRSKKKVKVKNWKGITKDRRTWRDLSEKAKTQKGLMCQMMSVIMQADPFILMLDSHYQTTV
jgi:hypothetical protein